ncbi:Uncharacterised protein [Mycobacteroides abscessus subsp. abscessus]|nr:Uncharacterised protein [Mycobacteroides abscessus subsp. abscessus]
MRSSDRKIEPSFVIGPAHTRPSTSSGTTPASARAATAARTCNSVEVYGTFLPGATSAAPMMAGWSCGIRTPSDHAFNAGPDVNDG